MKYSKTTETTDTYRGFFLYQYTFTKIFFIFYFPNNQYISLCSLCSLCYHNFFSLFIILLS